MKSINDIKKMEGFDIKSLRVFRSSEDIAKMPVKNLTADEMREALTDPLFNPVVYYQRIIALNDNEFGHNEHFRLILRK